MSELMLELLAQMEQRAIDVGWYQHRFDAIYGEGDDVGEASALADLESRKRLLLTTKAELIAQMSK